MKKLLLASALSLTLAPAFAAPTPIQSFNSEDGAQVHCPLDKVVWLDTKTHLFYYRSSTHYANSGHGGFVCRKDAVAAGNKVGPK